jgi:hypothetical protein
MTSADGNEQGALVLLRLSVSYHSGASGLQIGLHAVDTLTAPEAADPILRICAA